MKRVILKKPACLTYVKWRGGTDKSLSLHFGTDEATSEESTAWNLMEGMAGHVVFSPDYIQTADIPQEDSEVKQKSPSQRLRGVIYRYWETLKDVGDFEGFYRTYMEKLINFIKGKIV